LHFRNISFTL